MERICKGSDTAQALSYTRTLTVSTSTLGQDHSCAFYTTYLNRKSEITLHYDRFYVTPPALGSFLKNLRTLHGYRMAKNAGTWLGEVSYCSWLTVLPGSAWVRPNNTVYTNLFLKLCTSIKQVIRAREREWSRDILPGEVANNCVNELALACLLPTFPLFSGLFFYQAWTPRVPPIEKVQRWVRNSSVKAGLQGIQYTRGRGQTRYTRIKASGRGKTRGAPKRI